MNTPTTLVMQRGATQFTSWGASLGQTLRDTDETISARLRDRIHRYACGRVRDAGFGLVLEWPVRVEAFDAEAAPADRVYSVTWTNAQGNTVSLSGILISHRGHPVVDHHGLSIEEQ